MDSKQDMGLGDEQTLELGGDGIGMDQGIDKDAFEYQGDGDDGDDGDMIGDINIDLGGGGNLMSSGQVMSSGRVQSDELSPDLDDVKYPDDHYMMRMAQEQ